MIIAVFLALPDFSGLIVGKRANVKMKRSVVKMMAYVSVKLVGWVHVVKRFARRDFMAYIAWNLATVHPQISNVTLRKDVYVDKDTRANYVIFRNPSIL